MTAVTTSQKNVFGEDIAPCCFDPVTGYFRDGHCHTDATDRGLHTVCARMTKEFLAFSQSVGNDLSTPRPEFGFPGLKPGDDWCLCANRWLQAHNEGRAPRIYLRRTHERTLQVVPLSVLKPYALDLA